MKTRTQISLTVTAKLISAFVFATRMVQSLYFLNPKFQACSDLLWSYSPVCVRPGRKSRRPVFSQRGLYSTSYNSCLQSHKKATWIYLHLQLRIFNFYLSCIARKPVFWVSDQVRLKLCCTATKDGLRLEISDLGSRGIVLSM